MQIREDVNKYNTNAVGIPADRVEGEFSKTAGATAKTVFGMLAKLVKTLFFIGAITGLIVFISVASYIYSLRDSVPPDLTGLELDFTSSIKIQDPATGEFVHYQSLPVATENRVWADMKDLNPYVMHAMVAIEDKRFYEHHGVDWYTTFGSVYKLASASDQGGGGSTITQQLIKNLTKEDMVSINRKITEIFKALNLEKKYSKDEILLMYLNVVNFGGRSNGVQAAANYYFGKDIKDCSLAETAAIVGITQYPYLYNPYNDREKNKERQKTVLLEMYNQGYITKTEYDNAIEESKHMVFADESDDVEEESVEADDWNWYTETMIPEVVQDLAELYGYSTDVASLNLYKGGYTIYSAMNKPLQEGVEALFLNPENQPADPEIQYGIYLMDYDGKTLAVVGSREIKTQKLVFNYATDAYRQTGSSIKPLSVYGPALEAGEITWGTVLKDQPIKDFYGPGNDGPNNFSRTYRQQMNVYKAIEMSQNAPVAYLLNILGIDNSYNFLVDKLHFSHLDPAHDKNPAPLALGGFNRGASVQEMTAGFQIFGNGGVYNKPYTYYYVTDHDGNVVLDNRNKTGEQVMKPENAGVMNKLLQNVVYGPEGTAYQVKIDGIDNIFGKTGTSESNFNFWFIGGTPFGIAGVWNGYADRDYALEDSTTAKVMWRKLMTYVYENYQLTDSGYTISENIVEKKYCRSSGLIAGSHCYDTSWGWYANIEGGIPRVCNGGSDHVANGAKSGLSTPTPEPSPTPAATETPAPTEVPATPSQTPAPTQPPESSSESEQESSTGPTSSESDETTSSPAAPASAVASGGG